MTSSEMNTPTKLWLKNSDAVFGYVLANARNSTDADDIFQSVGLAVLETKSAPKDEAGFLPWVFEVARRRVLKFYRNAGRTTPVPPELAEQLATTAEQVHQRESATDRREALLHCVQKLSPENQELIAQHYGERSSSVAQIAQQRDRTEQGIYSLLYRIRVALRDCVQRRLRREDAT